MTSLLAIAHPAISRGLDSCFRHRGATITSHHYIVLHDGSIIDVIVYYLTKKNGC